MGYLVLLGPSLRTSFRSKLPSGAGLWFNRLFHLCLHEAVILVQETELASITP